MEVQAQELIEKIKKEGVDAAKAEGEKIVSQAKSEASEILSQAEKKAASIVENAQKESDKILSSSQEMLKQAGRDLVLSLKAQLESLIVKATSKAVSKTLSPQEMIKLVKMAMEGQKSDKFCLEACEVLCKEAKSVLADEVKSGLEVRPNPNLSSGFVLKEKNGNAYYDFTSEEIVALLKPYLNESLAKVFA